MPMDIPEGVGALLLKSGSESHQATMATVNNGIAHSSETLRTMSNLKPNEVGPIEAKSTDLVLSGSKTG